MESYKKYLIKTIGINETDADLFLSGFDITEYKKGDLIVKEGDKYDILRIILKGSARGFVIVDGKEITTNFYFENDHVYDYINYLRQKKSEMNIQALSPVKVIEMPFEAMDFLNLEIIGFHKMSFNLFKINVIKIERERQNLIIKTPRDRYLDLLKNNKQIISRVPQYQAASYIGISPEYLSRIRKEIASC